VSGVGSGGAEIFALDVTDPSQFSEGNASTLVLGDWSNTALPHLGNTVGTPLITRMHNGQWAIIFGNGLGSGTSAGIYIGLVNSSTGKITFQFLDTGVGSSTSANGIAYVSSVDLDGDHIADYLYAGDLQGNVWRFDVTSATASSWKVSTFGSKSGTATPLYVAKNASGTVQPITTAVTVDAIQSGSNNLVMVLFGTGQLTPFTTTSANVYATGTQTFYGIWDWDMAGWNKLSTVDYAALAEPQSFGRTSLLSQSVVSSSTTTTGGQVLGYRTLPTGTQVCWQGSSTCTPSSSNVQYGWYFDFPDSQEQVIYNPVMVGGAIVVSSAEPPVIAAQQCSVGLQEGWTMAFDPASGGGQVQNFFPNSNGSFTATNGASVAGIRLDAVGSPTAVTYNGQSYLISQTIKNVPTLNQVNPQGGNSPARVSWREVKL
jgi:type IV pilus assembly protein PilY1